MSFSRRLTLAGALAFTPCAWAAGSSTVAASLTSSVTLTASVSPDYSVKVRAAAPTRRSASEVVRGREVLEAAPHRSADELLFVVPGLFVTQHGGEGKAFQIFYRGFDAVHGQDLEIWAGGAPVNDVSNLHGQGYADLHFLPVEVVRELRATPGTYDPRQGDFAVAGTVRLELGYPEPGVTASAELGSFGARRLFLAYHPESSSEQTFGAVELFHTGGFGPSRVAERASAVAQWQTALSGGEELRLMASAYSGRYSSAGVLLLSDVEGGRVDRFGTYDPAQGGAASRGQLVLELRRAEADTRWAVAAYGVLRSMRLRENFTGYLQDPSGDTSQQLNSAVVTGAHGTYRRSLGWFSERDAVEAGLQARIDVIEQSQRRLSSVDGAVTATEVEAAIKAYDVAGFLELDLSPLEVLSLRGGARADGLGYFTEEARGSSRASQGAHLGAKGTIDLHPLRSLSVLLSYGDGFRSPQARSLAEGQTTPFTTVRSVELGAQLRLPWLSASLAGFRTTLSDDLVFDQATARNERVPATERLGATLDAGIRGFDGLSLTANLTFTHATFDEADDFYRVGDLVPYAPQLVARLDASYERALLTLFDRELTVELGGAVSVLARRPLPFGELGHDVVLADLRAELAWGPVELGLAIFNLLDAGWYDGEFVFASRWDPSRAAAIVPERVVTVGAPRALQGRLSVHL